MEKESIHFEGKNLIGNSGLISIEQFAEKLNITIYIDSTVRCVYRKQEGARLSTPIGVYS